MANRCIRALSLCLSVAVGVVLANASPARAAFHLWSIDEVYTNSSGTLQFIELVDTSGGQNFVNGQQIQVSNLTNSLHNTFILPGGSLSGNTFNHHLLFGTSGLHAAGAPTPDYIIPNGFLFQAGGSIAFFGQNGGGYTALPTDGILSRTWNGGNAVNSPVNYAGQTGQVVPEPATMLLLAGGAMGLLRRKLMQRA